MRPIDAEALMERLEEIGKEPDYQHEGENWCVGVIIAQTEVDSMPTLSYKDLVPQGEWIEDGYVDKPCVCSYCGVEAHYTSRFKETFAYNREENLQSASYEEIREYVKSNFCPNCGARMKGGESE